jgi:hypothetical protein
MRTFLEDMTSDRKMRLVAAACGRSIWHLLPNEDARKLLTVVERSADGLATDEEVREAEDAFPPTNSARLERRLPRKAQIAFMREIIGNPFCPVTIDPTCLTPTVTSLAAAAYEERALPSGELDPARLAVLADALEEAGCTDSAILDHLRSPGPHVRGCWPLDLALCRK